MVERAEGRVRGDETPFFIVGSGRSGTTLVRSLLDAHPALAVTPETHYLKRAFREGAARQPAPDDFPAFWRDLTAWSRFQDARLDADAVLARVEAGGERSFRAVFAAMLHEYAAAHGKRRAGEKTPGHYRYLPTIFAWFPGARVLVLRRDPRDVVASHLRSPWVTGEIRPGRLRAPLVRRLRLFHVAERATLWREANGPFLGGADGDPRMHVVRYERLVRDPEGEVARICAFLGEAFDPAMLAPRAEDQATPPAGAADPGWRDWAARHHARAGASVSDGSIGRWREALSASEAALVEAICGAGMRHHGYVPETGRRFWHPGRGLLAAGHLEDRLRRRERPGAVPHQSGRKPR